MCLCVCLRVLPVNLRVFLCANRVHEYRKYQNNSRFGNRWWRRPKDEKKSDEKRNEQTNHEVEKEEEEELDEKETNENLMKP